MKPQQKHKRDVWNLRADDAETDPEFAPAPRYKLRPIKCINCGTPGLHWKTVRKLGRRLADADGVLHECPNRSKGDGPSSR